MMHGLPETLLVYTVVGLCAVYCLWVFLPNSVKRRTASGLMRRFSSLEGSRTLRALTQTPAGCSSGCGSCSTNAAKTVREHKVQLFRRR